MILSHYAMSRDGTKLALVPEVGGDRIGVWLADASGVDPPQRISSNRAHRVAFGAPGEIVYESGELVHHLMRVGEDKSGERRAHPEPMAQLMSVSPDGKWAMVGVAEVGTHGTGVTLMKAFPLTGGEPTTSATLHSRLWLGAILLLVRHMEPRRHMDLHPTPVLHLGQHEDAGAPGAPRCHPGGRSQRSHHGGGISPNSRSASDQRGRCRAWRRSVEVRIRTRFSADEPLPNLSSRVGVREAYRSTARYRYTRSGHREHSQSI